MSRATDWQRIAVVITGDAFSAKDGVPELLVDFVRRTTDTITRWQPGSLILWTDRAGFGGRSVHRAPGSVPPRIRDRTSVPQHLGLLRAALGR